MGIISAITELAPETQIKCEAFLAKCKEVGFEVEVNETRREDVTQLLYYILSRLDVTNNPNIVAEMNEMRQRHGFWALTPWEATKKPITWTLKSKHLVGKAFDACPVRNGKAWWGAPQDVWDKMGEIGESVGLKWGGRWKNKDSPHFEEP